MNIVFFGTSEFAVPSLTRILNSHHKVSMVVTQPDKRKGRHLKKSASSVKVVAQSKDLRVYQPQKASGRDCIEILKDLVPDLFVVVAFGQILSKDLIELPLKKSINLHGSLLPKYRGAAPINWAIINGENLTGVTVIMMNERMDGGDIILQKDMPIEDDDTSLTLSEKLAETGAEVLLQAIDLIDSGQVSFTKQDEASATYAPKLKKEDGLIDWSKSAREIHNLVRGLVPWPGAFTHFGEKTLKICKTEVAEVAADNRVKAGEVIDITEERGIIVKTGSGSLVIKHLQLEGKKLLDAPTFVRGQRIGKGFRFGGQHL